MTARQRVLLHLSDLADEDVDALLPIVERLRAKRLAPTQADVGHEYDPTESPADHSHRQRFGALVGTARIVCDIESPVETDDDWTYSGLVPTIW